MKTGWKGGSKTCYAYQCVIDVIDNLPKPCFATTQLSMEGVGGVVSSCSIPSILCSKCIRGRVNPDGYHQQSHNNARKIAYPPPPPKKNPTNKLGIQTTIWLCNTINVRSLCCQNNSFSPRLVTSSA